MRTHRRPASVSSPRLRASAALAALAALLACAAPRVARADRPEGAHAEQAAAQAYEQYAAGRYAEAIASYLRAYEVSKTGVILLNVANIYERKLGEPELAADYYRRYLHSPDAEPSRVKKVNEHLAALKKDADAAARAASAPGVAAAAPAPPPPAAPPATEPVTAAVPPASGPAPETNDAPSSGGAAHTAGVVLLATGVAGAGASLVLGALTKVKNDEANRYCDGSACTDARGVSAAHDAGAFARAATVSGVAALAFIGAGVTFLVVAPKSGESAAPLTLRPHVGAVGAGAMGGGVTLGGSF